MAISYKIVSQVTIDLTEEDLKQIIIEKIQYDNPNINVEDIQFSGSRKKGQNINIDIKANLAGSEKPIPATKKKEVVEDQMDIEEVTKPKKKSEPIVDQSSLDKLINQVEQAEQTDEQRNMALIDEVLAEEPEPIEEEMEEVKKSVEKVELLGSTKSLAELLS